MEYLSPHYRLKKLVKSMTSASVRFLTALPVYNEASHVDAVLDEVVQYASDVLVVDDGSTDGTAGRLAARDDVFVVRHPENHGYGAALKTAFDYAIRFRYDVLVTIDCDGQHEPQRIRDIVAACRDADIVSGSRYLSASDAKSQAPVERRQINQLITRELNERLGLSITDAFCGFKAYRVCALAELSITDPGYAMPLGTMGAGGSLGAANCRSAGAADLPRGKTELRRQPRRRRQTHGVLSSGARSCDCGDEGRSSADRRTSDPHA